MKRFILCALVLLACTKARTSDAPSAGSAPATPPPAPMGSATAPGASAAPAPTSALTADVQGGVGAEAIRGPDVDSKKSPGVSLNDQLGGSGTPARGGRSLVVVKSRTALDKTTFDVAEMEFDYVRKGQASVKRCFEELRAKDPSAKGILTLQFAVDVTGAVVDAQVEGFNSEVASCVQTVMSTWTFSAPDKRTRFELVLDLVIG